MEERDGVLVMKIRAKVFFYSVYHVSNPRFCHSLMYFSNLKNFHYSFVHTRHNDSV